MKKAMIAFAITDVVLTLIAIAAGIGYVTGRNAGMLEADLIHRAELVEAREQSFQDGYNASEIDRSVLRTQEPILETE